MNISSMKRAKKYLLGLAVIAIAATAVGCESLTMDSAASKKKKKDASWFSFKKKEYKNPQSMTATWSHDILTLPGKAPTRGFGGRFYFYDEKTHYLSFTVGSAITAMCNAVDEYEECLLKAKAMIQSLQI